MEPVANVLRTGDQQEIRLALSQYAETASPSEEELLRLLGDASVLGERFTASFDVDSPYGVITWRDYESLIWQLGESFRQVLQRNRRLRRRRRLFAKVEQIALDPLRRCVR